MSLENGRLNKYKDVLSKSLQDEGVGGKHLAKINVLHIKGWGINNFDDKEFLMSKIKELIDNNRDNENDDPNKVAMIGDEEGAISGGYFK